MRYARVKIMGERGAGTNFLASLIEANFVADLLHDRCAVTEAQKRVLGRIPPDRRLTHQIIERIEDHHHETLMPETGGWKHACLTDRMFDRLEDADGALALCIVRHPALWLDSFWRRPFHAYSRPAESMDAFLATPWLTRPRDEIPAVILPGPACLWHWKTASYLDQAARRTNVVVLCHEDLLRDHVAVLTRLGERLEAAVDVWRIPEGNARDWQLPENSEARDALRRRDFNRLKADLPDDPWRTLTPSQIEQAVAQIGADTILRAGYALPESAA